MQSRRASQTGHAADVRIVDAPVEMHERDARQHLLAGEAAARLTRRDAAAGRIVGAVVPEPAACPMGRRRCARQPERVEWVIVGELAKPVAAGRFSLK